MPKYLDIDGLRTLWAQITNKIGQQSNATAEALEGKADLVEGKIPASQLPSYVDDVLEYANKASFPATGESGKIYLDLATNLTYRWGGTAYTEISPSLALGTTSSTAYRGDYGAAAYTHAVTNKGIAKSSGLYKITTNAEGHVTAATAVVKADITGLGIPAQDTTYGNATTTTNGLMSSTDKTKLDSINLSDLVKSVNGITPDSNGNIAIEVNGGTVSGDYLPLTGGTLSGNLTISNSNNYSYLYLANQNGENIGGLYASDSENRLYLINHAPNSAAGKYEGYGLPPVTTDNLTEHKWYKLLTSKETVTIEQGGTGATDANIALANLGGRKVYTSVSQLGLTKPATLVNIYKAMAPGSSLIIRNSNCDEIASSDSPVKWGTVVINKTNGSTYYGNGTYTTATSTHVTYDAYFYQDGASATPIFSGWKQVITENGGTVTGSLIVSELIVKRSNNYPTVRFYNSNDDEAGCIQFNASTHKGYIALKATDTTYQELYWLPGISTGLTENKNYDILTSKGATITGNLVLRNGADDSLMYFNPTNSSAAGGVIIYNKPTSNNTNNSRIFFRQYSYSSSNLNTRTSYYENYYLPKTASGLTANGSYEIITSKGGTTTGKVYLANGSGVHGADTGWTSIGFYGTSNKLRGSLMLSDGNRFHFNQQETGASYAERYLLPTIATGLTGDVWYNILTSKNAVTVAQGGTGATTVRDAINNLGLRVTPYIGSGDYADITDLNNLTLSGLFQVAGNFTNAPLTNPCFILNVKGTNNRTTQFGWRSNVTTATKNIYMRRQGDTAGTWDDWEIVAGPGLNTDTKVTQTSTNPTTSTKYYLLAGSSSSTTTAGAVFNSALNVNFKNGTASAEGDIELVLGNSTATGTAGNKTGWLCLYSPGTSYHMIKPASTNSALTHTLPAKSGTILNTGTFVASTTAPSSPVTGMFWVDIS